MAAKKVKAVPKHKSTERVSEKNPILTVQIGEARMLKKDLLESIREIIIFMQGYEHFRKLQEEKVALFAKLRLQLRDINRLIDSGLRKDLPQGKLRPLGKIPGATEKKSEAPESRMPEMDTNVTPENYQKQAPQVSSGLDELEAQLQEIENQLKKVG
jgi:hypothetical protein